MLQQDKCTSVPDATAPRSNSVALNTNLACLPPTYMHLVSQVPAPVFLALCCRLLLMRTPLMLVPPVQPKGPPRPPRPPRPSALAQLKPDQLDSHTAPRPLAISEVNLLSFRTWSSVI